MTEGAHHNDPEHERKLAQLFDTTDFDRLTKELLIYTAGKHKQRVYRGGREPWEYVNEAIKLTLEGRRHFNFDGDKTFTEFLASVIDSVLSHDTERAARHVQLVQRSDAEEGSAPLGGYDESRLVADDHTEQEVVERVDAEKLAAKLPADLQRYEKARRSGAKSAKDVSKVLGVSVRTVRNYERRMKRKRRQKI